MSQYLLCIVASFGRSQQISGVIPETLFPERVLCDESNYVERLEAVKKENEKPIVLVILGPLGHLGIKTLCDDYDKPEEQRRVKWMHSISAGVDWYNLSTITQEMGTIPLTTGRGAYSFHLALHVMTSILHFNTQIATFQRCRAEKNWKIFPLREITSCKVGILGYGDIGREAARLLAPIGMAITGVRRKAVDTVVDEFGVTQVWGKEEMMRVIRESDFVVNALPGTAETKGIFNYEMFKTMKKDAVYINIGRGSTQVDAELAQALQDGIIAGAAVDVFEVEPLPKTSPLWDVPDEKILLTPHNVCITEDSFEGAVRIFVKNAEEFVSTGTVSGYKADLTLGY